ncbi:unnamed protein product [Linum tenue]|uniref:LsmAD domain-containing protein n=1 Tax=Linum tenue TaxID=586396 RepID=A0AAV0NU85_9ROSI|nr:unnamed protein product [Linum tenue]CAI0461914.1 unnamed protein product [Linum tenue]
MNTQQTAQLKSSANGFARRRSERESGMRLENKHQSGKLNQNRSMNAIGTSKAPVYESPSRDRLVYLSTCLIGHPVEVRLKNGSIYSGTCHTTNVEQEFAIILKMARMTKDASYRGSKQEYVMKAPSKTLIIPGKEVAEVIAKDVPVTVAGQSNELQNERHEDILIDSSISHSRHVELDRELSPWVPDEDDPQCPGLENIFDGPWNRGWDQFETNKMLFGVKSTFDEELYTTRLEKGPRMRELEREATRIAREIEGEDTEDLHLAEERGINLGEDFDGDEEVRFSSVIRGRGLDDSGYDEDEDILLDKRNTETFGDVPASSGAKTDHLHRGTSNDSAGALLTSSVEMPPTEPEVVYVKADGESSGVSACRQPGTFASGSDHAGATSASSHPAVSPSSSLIGSSSSENSTLNPHAKEFKFNPNAKSFTPSHSSPVRPPSPVSDGSYYFTPNVTTLPQMHGMPVGIMGPSYSGHQHVLFNPQVAPLRSPQPYFHPSGPQYGQQMNLGHPRQVLYMPGYQPVSSSQHL